MRGVETASVVAVVAVATGVGVIITGVVVVAVRCRPCYERADEAVAAA